MIRYSALPGGLLLLLLLCLGILVRLPTSGVRAIVRSEPGDAASAVKQFPFAVSLQLINGSDVGHFCGGTHLGDGWILTAAHCVVPFNQTQIVAQIGGESLTSGSAAKRYPIVEMQILRTYNRVTMVGDIALLRAATATADEADQQLLPGVYSPAPSPSSRRSGGNRLRLPARTDGTTVNGEVCYIFGYGSESYDGPVSETLRYGTVLALELDSCIGMMGAVVAPPPDSGMFCAIGQADACKGDSGGGYVCRKPSSTGPFVLRGIISYGVGCGAAGTPGVYTDVAYYLHHYPMSSIISD